MSIFRQGLGKLLDITQNVKYSEENILTIKNEIFKYLINNNVTVDVAFLIITLLTSKLVTEQKKYNRFSNFLLQVKNELRSIIYDKLVERQTVSLLTTIQKLKTEKINDPLKIIFVGINGVGKTTTLAKIGNFLKEQDLEVLFAAGDTFRPGAIEQITAWGTRIGIDTVSEKYGSKPMSVLTKAEDIAISQNIDVILADTSGRMENEKNLMREFQSIKKKFEPDLILFIGDSNTGSNLLTQLSKFQEMLNVDGIILTKFDVNKEGGSVLSCIFSSEVPIFYLSNGQELDKLLEFDPDELIMSMF